MKTGLLAVLLVASMAGCDDDTGTGTMKMDMAVVTAPADMAMAGNADMTAPMMVKVSGVVVGYETQMPLKDVVVCNYPDKKSCATTGADGKYQIEVPGNSNTGALFTLASYQDSLAELVTTTKDVSFDYQVIKSGTAQTLSLILGKTIDPAKGIVIVTTVGLPDSDSGASRRVGGGSGSLTPAGSDGPYYFGANGLPDKTATMAGPNGQIFFLNAAPGDLDFKFTSPAGKNCDVKYAGLAWPGATGDVAKVKVVANTLTAVAILCM